MSDFKNIQDFRKSKTSKFKFQDPTYLSFVMLFDFTDSINSPFLSEPAESFLAKLSNGGAESDYYAEKLEALQNFKKALKTINNEMPWYWQGIAGLEKIQQWDPTKPYIGGDEATLTISTLESINLPIAGLMHLYRKATFDERKWTWVLPANLRKFRMYVYVTEVRTIQNMPSLSFTGVRDKNSGIAGQSARPYFMFGLKFCEFDMTSGTGAFSDLKKSPEGAAEGEIVISYEAIDKIEARALNGIVESKYNTDKISPSPDTEGNSPTDLLGFAKAQGSQILKDAATRGVTDLRTQSLDRLNELERDLKANTIGKAKAALTNIYSDFVRGIDNAGNPESQSRNIGAAINSNIYDLTGGEQTIIGALNNAAAGSLGNVYE